MKIFRHMPENRQRFAFMFPSWDAAVNASREIVQGEFGMPAVYRISDPEETEIGLKLKGFDDGAVRQVPQAPRLGADEPLPLHRHGGGRERLRRQRQETGAPIARAHGAMSLTGYATKQWEHGRYSDVHMRDDLLDYGIIIDTLETGVTWDNLHNLHKRARVRQAAARHLCMTHARTSIRRAPTSTSSSCCKPKDDRGVLHVPRRTSSAKSSSTAARSAITTASAGCSRRGWKAPRYRSRWMCCARSSGTSIPTTS